MQKARNGNIDSRQIIKKFRSTQSTKTVELTSAAIIPTNKSDKANHFTESSILGIVTLCVAVFLDTSENNRFFQLQGICVGSSSIFVLNTDISVSFSNRFFWIKSSVSCSKMDLLCKSS